MKETVVYEIESLLDEILDKAELAQISFEELNKIMNVLYEEREKKDE